MKIGIDWGVIIDRACELIRGYNTQDIRPTLRQVHYRLASERVGGYENIQRCYKQLSTKLVKARKNELISWGALADHVRYRWWSRPSGRLVPNVDELVEKATEDLGEDPWETMGKRVVLWLEKDTLAELVYDAVGGFYIPLAVSRGYSSWTFIYDNLDVLSDSNTRILYLGDHDPSGMDIERFTEEAVEYFGVELELKRVALTYGQVQAYNLLPNPTKKADTRAEEYMARYGDECWELDALEPIMFQSIVEEAVKSEIDPGIWSEVVEKNRDARERAKEELLKKLR